MFCDETGKTSNLNDNIGKFSRKLNSICSEIQLSKKRCGNDNKPVNGYRCIKLKCENNGYCKSCLQYLYIIDLNIKLR